MLTRQNTGQSLEYMGSYQTKTGGKPQNEDIMNVFDLNPSGSNIRRVAALAAGDYRGRSEQSAGPMGRRAWPFSVASSRGGNKSLKTGSTEAPNRSHQQSCNFES
jgi:hypothetical protein